MKTIDDWVNQAKGGLNKKFGRLQENQFFAMYNIWVNPTKEQLQEFNKSLLLDKNEHLQNFEGYEKLYKDRQVNDVFELER